MKILISSKMIENKKWEQLSLVHKMIMLNKFMRLKYPGTAKCINQSAIRALLIYTKERNPAVWYDYMLSRWFGLHYKQYVKFQFGVSSLDPIELEKVVDKRISSYIEEFCNQSK